MELLKQDKFFNKERFNELTKQIEDCVKSYETVLIDLKEQGLTEEELKQKLGASRQAIEKRRLTYCTEQVNLVEEAQNKYIEYLERNPALIMEDIKEVVEAITYEDYISFIEEINSYKKGLIPPFFNEDDMKKGAVHRDKLEAYYYFDFYFQPNVSTYYEYLRSITLLQLQACIIVGSLDLHNSASKLLKDKAIKEFNQTPLEANEYYKCIQEQIKEKLHTLGLKTIDEEKEEEEIEEELEGQTSLFEEKQDNKKAEDEQQKEAIASLFFPPHENIQTERLNKSLYINTKLQRQVFNQKYEKKIPTTIQSVQVKKKDKQAENEVVTYCTISLENLPGVKTEVQLTRYEKDVYDAIAGLYSRNQKEISPQMIYRQMVQNPEAKLTEKHAKRIKDCMELFMYSKVELDLTEEAKAFNYDFSKAEIKKKEDKKNEDRFIVEGPMLSAIKVEMRLNGKITNGWKISKDIPPLMYAYAVAKKELLYIPQEVIDANIRNDEELIILRKYLLENIIRIKNGNTSKTILFETMYKEMGATDDKTKQRKIRKNATILLDHFANTNYIKNYKILKRSKTNFYAIEILYNS